MKILSLILLLLSTTLYAKVDINPMLVAGFRAGKASLNDNSAVYAGFKLNFLSAELSNFKEINFLSPGINYQDDENVSISISPFSVNNLGGMTFGLDIFIKEEDVKGGGGALFFGVKF